MDMKQILSKVASAFLIVATASSCYNLTPENNAGGLTSVDIYSGVGNVLNIDSLVDYVRSFPKKWDFTVGHSSWRDDVEIKYSYDGKHHKNVNITCDLYNYDDVVPDELTGDHLTDSLHEDAHRKFDQVKEKDQIVHDALLNLCKSLACKVKPSNSSMWEYHEGDVDSMQYSIALREYPQGDKMQRFGDSRVAEFLEAPEIIRFHYSETPDSVVGNAFEGYGRFNYYYSPDSVYNMTHELLDKKGFAKRIKPIFKQKGIESRDLYLSHDADCPIKPSWDNMIYVRTGLLESPSHSETKGIIYTIHSREQMEDVLRQLTATIWAYLDLHPYLFYEFIPDIYVPALSVPYSTIQTYFTMEQYTPLHEEYTILVHQCQQTYHILLLDVKGDIWLPNEWVLMKSWKNGEVIYDKQAKASSELLVGPAVRIECSQYINRAWSDSSIVNKKKR